MGIKKTEVEFLAGLKGPRHWSEEDARRALALQEGSGESRAAFARRHGLRATRLAWWGHRLTAWEPDVVGERLDGLGAGAFVQLVGAREAATRSAATVRVGHVVVELTTLDAASARFIAALSHALGGEACS